jgi:hypothetical protein
MSRFLCTFSSSQGTTVVIRVTNEASVVMISIPASSGYHVLYSQTICNQPTTYKKASSNVTCAVFGHTLKNGGIVQFLLPGARICELSSMKKLSGISVIISISL